MLYEYIFSTGEYSDYSDTSIYHKNKFTNKDFVTMYNDVIAEIGEKGGYFGFEEVAEKMCDKFGFIQLEVVTGIHAGYSSFKQIPIEKVTEGNKFFDMEDYNN